DREPGDAELRVVHVGGPDQGPQHVVVTGDQLDRSGRGPAGGGGEVHRVEARGVAQVLDAAIGGGRGHHQGDRAVIDEVHVGERVVPGPIGTGSAVRGEVEATAARDLAGVVEPGSESGRAGGVEDVLVGEVAL